MDYSILPSNPQDQKDLLSEIDSCVDAMTRIAGEKDFIRETVKALAEKFEMKPKHLNKLVRLRYQRNAEEVKQETEEIVEAYNKLTGGQE